MIHPRIGWGLERRSAQLILLGWTECRTYRQRINPTDPLTWKSQSAWPTGKFGCLLAGPSGPVQQAQAASDLRNTGYRRAHHGLQASSKMGRATRMSRLHPWPARRGLSLKTSQPSHSNCPCILPLSDFQTCTQHPAVCFLLLLVTLFSADTLVSTKNLPI